ncbi:hypothetical protein LR48_Vigan02g072600 [Vigna angularis]|uniref:DNA topoisomerase (ATP-hydrolyzing) n=1 Tax=Phaseolus angularis TaxID=3914 RepID=A0A0L9TVR8_PHAAN|nr:hypothetical protein LR48_Vigan02g072600 [Vigna angularis]
MGKTIADLRRLVSYVLGLYKISDEILIYTVDNKKTHGLVSSRSLNSFAATCSLTSTMRRGSRRPPVDLNGYSAKLTNIFSNEFIIKIADEKRKKYKQVFFSALQVFLHFLSLILHWIVLGFSTYNSLPYATASIHLRAFSTPSLISPPSAQPTNSIMSPSQILIGNSLSGTITLYFSLVFSLHI